MSDAPSSSTQGVKEPPSPPLHEEEGDGEGTAEQELELDAEAESLLEELSASQAEVQRMIDDHRRQQEELGGMRANLAAELEELQQERWKLELYGELEVLKRQLESLKALEADLDASEAILDATEPGASPGRLLAAPVEPGAGADAVASSTAAGGATREDGGDKQAEEENVEDDEEYDPEAIAEMQAKLDQDLAEMFAQLQAVKSEAAAVSAHKTRLEAELKALLEEQEEEAGQEAAGGEEGAVVEA